MGKLIYTAMASLDGYVEDAGGGFEWCAPDEEVHAFINELERPIGTYLYGRRLYQTMVYWETAGTAPEQSEPEREYAAIWQAANKIVFSRTLASVSSSRTRLEREFRPDLVASVKASSERELTVGGAELAAEALRAGLVDEVQLFLQPITVGAGKPTLPGGIRLRLLEEQHFRAGTVYLRYAVHS